MKWSERYRDNRYPDGTKVSFQWDIEVLAGLVVRIRSLPSSEGVADFQWSLSLPMWTGVLMPFSSGCGRTMPEVLDQAQRQVANVLEQMVVESQERLEKAQQALEGMKT